jgi:hypothetical protein
MALCNSKRRPVEVCRIGCAGKLVYDQPSKFAQFFDV